MKNPLPHRNSRWHGLAAAAVLALGACLPVEASNLLNISTRARIQTGDNVLIGGFIVSGSTSKTVVVRARGPSLGAAGVANPLANPRLDLYAGQTLLASNDDFGTAPNLAALNASGFAPSNALESAILTTLPPGAYTAVISGVGNTTGVGIVEVFEVDQAGTPMVNISTRANVLTGDDVLIGGFIISGSTPMQVVVRARGPSLAAAGVTNPLANPMLQLFSGAAQIAVNDNWGTAANAATLTSSGFAPTNANEAAILTTLNPGAYTAIVSGSGGGTGVGIVEVFQVFTAPTATSAAATAITKTTATLNGTINDNGANTAVSFQYGTTTSYGSTGTATPATVGAGSGATPVSSAITGLACSTTYNFRVRGTNLTGTTNGGNLTFTTVDCNAVAPLATTGTPSFTSEAAGIVGSTVTSNGASTTVTIQYGTTTAYGNTVTAPGSPLAANAAGVNLNTTIGGLLCGTTYHYRVVATSALGSTNGADATLTTAACPAAGSHPRLWLSDPAVMARLTKNAVANTTEWSRLKTFCDSQTLVNAAAEYQGLEAYKFAVNFALCYRVVKALSGAAAAAPYAQKSINVLQQANNPVIAFTLYDTDSGFGARSFMPNLAITFDWLYDSPLYTATIKSQVLNRLLAAPTLPANDPNYGTSGGWFHYASQPESAGGGYSSDQPISNYNSGFQIGRMLASIAVEGEDPRAAAWVTDSLTRYNQARTKIDTEIPGGHWPEGWNYGPGVFERHLMVASAMAQYRNDNTYKTWNWITNTHLSKIHSLAPDAKYFYDDGLWSGDTTGDPRYNDMMVAGFTYGWGTPAGQRVKAYIDRVIAAGGASQPDHWIPFLFLDPTAQAADFNTLPRAYHATGAGLVTMRSDWTGTATWGSFAANRYLSYQGEQDPDAGQIMVYRRGQLLIDAAHTMFSYVGEARMTIFTNTYTIEGRNDPGPYTIANNGQLNYTDACPNPLGTNPIGVKAFVDGTGHAFTSGEFSAAYQNVPQNFPDPCGALSVHWLSRSVLFVRPGLFAVYDQVKKAPTQPQVQPIMHLWLPNVAPTLVGGDPKKTQLDNGTGGRLQIASVLPTAATVGVVATPRNNTQGPGVSSYHWTATLPLPSASYQNFLTVLRASDTASAFAFPTTTALAGTNANGTLVTGLNAAESANPVAMVFAENGVGSSAVPASISYAVPSATTTHYVAKLKPATSYVVNGVVNAGTRTVTITEQAGGTVTDAGGVLVFTQ